MRGQQLRPTVVQDACIFCTIRLQSAPKPTASQRRFLQSGYSRKKPAEAAVTRREDFENLTEQSRGATPKQSDSQGWASWRPASKSPDIEQRWQPDRNLDGGQGQTSSTPQRAAQQSQNPPHPSPPPHLNAIARENALRNHAKAVRANQSNSQSWQCQCGLRNLGAETTCMRCHRPAPRVYDTPKAAETDAASIVQRWKHVRRVGETGDSRPATNIRTQAQGRKEFPMGRNPDQGRYDRFLESKGFRFVGLESKFRRPRFGESEEPRRLKPQESPEWQGLKSQLTSRSGAQSSISNSRLTEATAEVKDQTRPQQAASYTVKKFSPSPVESPHTSRELPPSRQETQSERTNKWARWTPQETRADPTVLGNPQGHGNIDGQYASHDPKPVATTSDGWRVWTPSEPDVSDQTADPAPRDTSANERNAQNRMARRLQEMEEQGGKATRSRQRAPRFDEQREPRESRGSMRQARRMMEAKGMYDEFDDLDEDAVRRRQERKKEKKKQQAVQKSQKPPTPVYLPEFISVANLAGVLRVRIEDFTSKMTELGFEETSNDHILDAETAGLIASEFNFEPIVDEPQIQDLVAQSAAEDKSLLPQRPPVVTIMGHVDHGKTTLLDWLRKSSVAATEFGGITQHIGAFSVPMPSGRVITFLDTPGHAAFLDMRQRGANVTDIIILVVAADDSVKPQTIEAIKHAQAAQVPMIVAVNKIDKEDANVEKVKQDLARYGVEIEDYGGNTQVVCVSGKTGQGMETLEESAVALADILDMRVANDGPAEGWILEATTKKAGRVATVLVRRGTLHSGDIIVAGATWARVRTLRNEAGVVVASAGPGTPVEVDGWKDQPAAGDEVLQANTEQHARSVIDIRLEAAERVQLASDTNAINEARRLEQERREAAEAAAAAAKAGEEPTPPKPKETKQTIQEVPLLVKADVSGSVEAVLTSVQSLGNASVRPTILRSGVGAISEFDISHAASAKAHIVCFNVGLDQNIRRLAEAQGVKIVEQNIIYRLVDAVKGVLEEYLEPIRTKRVLGEAEVAQIFDINVRGRVMVPIAGCKVRNGIVGRKDRVLVRRGGEVIFDGALSSLKNRKQDATEIRKGTECGIGFEGWKDFQVGDLVQSYEEKVEKRTL